MQAIQAKLSEELPYDFQYWTVETQSMGKS
jgi:hypothetical protein